MPVMTQMDKDKLQKASDKLDKLKKAQPDKSKEKDGSTVSKEIPKDAFRKNLGCGG